MLRRPHWPLAALPILAGSALVAWLVAGPRGASEVSEVSDARPGSPGGPLLAANDREAAEGYRVEDGVAVPKERVSEEPGQGIVVLRVVDGSGRPVPGRTVRADLIGFTVTTPRGEVLATSRFVREPLRSRRTDAGGVARWTGLRERLFVQVQVLGDEAWTPAFAHVGVGSPLLTITVLPLAAFSVRVTDDQGRGVRGAWVMLYGPAEPGADPALRVFEARRGGYAAQAETRIQPERTDDAGLARLSLPHPVAGGRLWVAAEGFAPWVDLAWTPRDTEVRLERGQDLEGVVRDPRGEAVGDGTIRWELPFGVWGVARVEYDGTFVVRSVPPGGVRLEWRLAEAPALDGQNVRHATPGGAPFDFFVSLGSEAAIRIAGWPRQAGGQAFLTAQDDLRPDAPRFNAEIDPEGNARFQGLTPGRPYVLWVPPRRTPPGGRREPEMDGIVHRRDVRAGEDPIVVPLEAGRTIRGVIDLQGTDQGEGAGRGGSWRWASVEVRGLGVRLLGHAGETTADAREIPFEVGGVPAGSFTIVADVTVEHEDERPATHWTGEAPVPAGDEPVRLRLRPGPTPPDR